MLRAERWQGPYVWVTDGVCGNAGEDPFLYTDKQGHFHCLYHRSRRTISAAGGHAYSLDGYTWYTDEVRQSTGAS